MNFSSLYARIAVVFAVIVLALGLVLSWVGYATAKRHQHEILQRVNLGLAGHIAAQPGLIDDASASALFTHLMAVNPNIEVYLLDAEGNVLRSAIDNVALSRKRIALEPIRALLEGAPLPLRGDNPRHANGSEIFSAAPIVGPDGPRGYVYIVLLNDMYRGMVADAWQGYALRSGSWIVAASVILAIAAGLIAFAALTRRLQRTIFEIESFAAEAMTERSAIQEHDARSPIHNELDRLSSAFAAMRTRLRTQMEELHRQDELRRELVANVSHDLRTPLTSMQGYLETLVRMDGTLSGEERRKYLDVAVRQSRRVAKLSQQLFELARLECEDAQPQPELFSISELVHDIAQKFALSAQHKSIRISTHIEDEGLFAHADIGMIERVIGNLVENAIRHTPERGEVRLCARPSGRGIEVRIEDNGHGISADHLPGLLERGSTIRRMAAQRGGGLGLLIANRILKLHGSTIQAASRVGEGTSIGFVLPTPHIA